MSAPIRWLARYVRSRRGAISGLMALALVPIIGALGLALEVSNWWVTQRSAQNAADTAAMAASWNAGTTAAGSGSASSYSTTGCSSNPGYFDCEAVGAAAKSGFTNDPTNNKIVVYPQYLTSSCPGTLTNCWKVTVTKQLPIYLVSVLGYHGAGGSQNVSAIAISGLETQKNPDCLLGLGTGANVLRTNGAPGANLAGCDIALYGSGDCNGGNLNAPESFVPSGSTNKNCGLIQGVATPPPDPYAVLNSSIPADPCGGKPANYPQEASGPLPAGNLLSGNETWGATQSFCGDVQLTGNVEVLSNTTVVIYNGQLDLNAHQFQTAAAAGVTLIFAGSNTVGTGKTAITPNHAFTTQKGSTIDIAAPTSGTWSGVAMYQATNLTSNVAVSTAGNSPNMAFTGVIYQPNASDTFKGAIDKSTNGFACFIWVFNTMLVSGTADIYSAAGTPGVQSQCSQAGVTQIVSDTFVHSLVG